jgi:quercetin dioxygenase-like cupin family protein
MKRSEALAPLSRDHHHALEAARRLRRASGAELEAAVGWFGRFWEEHGQDHFAVEEELLLPVISDHDPEWHAAAQRVRDEHHAIRELVPGLRSGSAAGRLATARELGGLLHDHVRFEERRLFGLLEDRLDEAALVALGHAILERGRGHDVEPGGGRVEVADLVQMADEPLPAGVAWHLAGAGDLNANLVAFPAGQGVAAHINREVDVLIVGIAGDGEVVVDGVRHPVRPAVAVLIPRGARRETRAVSERFGYLTVHRSRMPLLLGPEGG